MSDNYSIESPLCNSNTDFDEVEDETGSAEINCGNCRADIYFTQADWGVDVIIDYVDKPETEEDVDD